MLSTFQKQPTMGSSGGTENEYLPPEQAKAMSEWQENMATVAERDWHMFQREMYTDCTFSVGQQRIQVKCHRMYLAKTSPYFSSMFYGDMKRKSEDVIHLPDVNMEVFMAMLKYVYLGKVQLSQYSYEVVCGLLHVAKMYLLPKCFRAQIRSYLWHKIYTGNLWIAIEFAKSNDEPKIEKTAWQVLDNETEEALQQSSFEDISKSTLISLVQRESLDCSELDLFQACICWAQSEAVRLGINPTEPSNLREILADVIPHIRFLTMDKESFALEVVETNMFSEKELHPMFMFYITGNLRNLSPFFCSKTTGRTEVKHKHIDVIAHCDENDDQNFKMGDTFDLETTCAVLTNGGINTGKSSVTIELLGVQVPTQVKDVTSDADESYQENLMLIVTNKNTSKILSVAKFNSVVKYNSIVDVPLYTPLTCGEPLGNSLISCFVIFGKSGQYPVTRDTNEEIVHEYNKVFCGIVGNYFYGRKLRYFHNMVYKFQN